MLAPALIITADVPAAAAALLMSMDYFAGSQADPDRTGPRPTDPFGHRIRTDRWSPNDDVDLTSPSAAAGASAISTSLVSSVDILSS